MVEGLLAIKIDRLFYGMLTFPDVLRMFSKKYEHHNIFIGCSLWDIQC